MSVSNPNLLVYSRWAVPGQTATAATAFTQGIPPYKGMPGNPVPILGTNKVIAANTAAGTFPGIVNAFGTANALLGKDQHLTVVTRLRYVTTGTAHKISIMRPLNWSTVATTVGASATTFTLNSDPGKYSTSYNYPLPSTVTAPVNVANLTFTTTHYYCVQLQDGTWFFDLCAGFNTSTLVVTTTGTLPTAAGSVQAGAIFYLFGSATTTNPQDGFTCPSFYSNANASGTAAEEILSGNNGIGEVSGIFPNDPLFFYSPNSTAQGWLAALNGYYSG